MAMVFHFAFALVDNFVHSFDFVIENNFYGSMMLNFWLEGKACFDCRMCSFRVYCSNLSGDR